MSVGKYERKNANLEKALADYKLRGKAFQRGGGFKDVLFNAMREGCLLLDSNLRVKAANSFFLDHFRLDEKETEEKPVFELGNGDWDISGLRTLLEEMLPRKKSINDFRIEHDFREIGRRVLVLNARKLDKLELVLLMIEDVTERTSALEELDAVNNTLKDLDKESKTKMLEFDRKLTRSQMAERQRISAILHDDLQQYLIALQMGLHLLYRKTERESSYGGLSKETSEMIKLCDKAIEKTRRLTSDLSPVVLKSQRLTDILYWLAGIYEAMHGLKIDVNITQDYLIHNRRLRELLLKLIRELFLNIVKHAHTHYANIEVHSENQFLVIRIMDNGSGFDMGQLKNTDSYGLSNITDQLNVYGGSLLIDSSPGKGTRIIIQLPMEAGAISVE